ncbi:hypothetical protein SELMODRAFT_427560 [Selaginella moellendorffii]|uniref:Chloride channel protein n=2 Tax=Selaginella moellendorffii TaxID=88036 RepID=D8SZZ9_SELML|nr:putative chloride channel-like protein CLC-g isoform X1 [Selaginella moellendorffii]EFJ09934.1 hypothetical protein SELMODRAFT_427560 [Selaginella moellendorffii]|eukprot:XP_002988905.1 putative chloride channel-like protein CLC-g isoform X1 [Selaginella moellendorffii]
MDQEAPTNPDLVAPLLGVSEDDKSKIFHKGVSHLSVFQTPDRLFESLDYEIIENDLFKQDWRARKKEEVFLYIVTKWAFAFLTGFIIGAAALIINFSVENIAGAKWLVASSYMTSGRTMTAFAIFTALNTGLVFLGAAMTVYLAPSAAGSGVPESKAYLNGIDAPRILEPITMVVKLLGSICVVSAGLYLGKEGPLIHIGSCVAYFLGQGGSLRYHMNWRWLRVFKNDRDRRDLVTCGCAGGVAAAFRAPIGGVLFALEEVTSWWRSALLWRAFFTTAVVAVMLQLGKQFCAQGICGLFGEGGLIMFDISHAYGQFGLLDLFPVVILGVLGGILGSVFNKLNTRVTKCYIYWYLRKPPYVKVIHACLMAILTSACCFWLPFLVKCRPCPDLSDIPGYKCPTHGQTGNFKGFNCPAGQYNDLAGLFFATKDDAVRNLFSFKTYREYHYRSILVFFGVSFIFSLITYGIAVPSGLFIPLIINGASLGRLVGMIMTTTTGNKMDEGYFAVLGAAAFLGGTMRMTVSLCVILLELTNNMLMLPMIMLVLLIAKTVGDIFNSAIWEMYVRIKGYPILEAKPEPFMQQLTAKDAVTTSVVSLSPVEQVSTVLMVLRNTTHNAFPVIGESSTTGRKVFLGLVLRSHLLVLLKNKAFHYASSGSAENSKMLQFTDFAKPATGKSLKIEDIDLRPEEELEFINVRHITNGSPYTVLESASLAKAYTLFRDLGLRHLCVVPREPEEEPIIGVLTRHNFLHENLQNMFPYLMPKKQAAGKTILM